MPRQRFNYVFVLDIETTAADRGGATAARFVSVFNAQCSVTCFRRITQVDFTSAMRFYVKSKRNAGRYKFYNAIRQLQRSVDDDFYLPHGGA